MIEFKYIIFNKSEYSSLNIEELIVNCAQPIRLSAITENGYVKYVGDVPSSVSALKTKSSEYSREQILPTLQNEKWMGETTSDF